MAPTLIVAGGSGRASRLPVIKTTVLVAALVLSLCASARAQSPPFCYNSPVGTTTYKSDYDTMSVFTNVGTYGKCGTCYLDLYASNSVIRTRPGKPNDTVSVELSFSCYDYCSYPNWDGFYATYTNHDTSGLSIDSKKNKASASVTATLNLEYSYGGSGAPTIPQTASVNVQGTGNGLSGSNGKCSGEYTYTNPCSVVTTTYSKNSNTDQSATFTGTIKLGDTTYNVASASQPSNGYISGSDSSSKTIVSIQ